MSLDESDVDKILSFLEAAVHSILFLREVYPASIFERRRKYGIPVRMSQFHELNEYISNVLKNGRELLINNVVESVAVIILAPPESQSLPVERYVFQIESSLGKDVRISFSDGLRNDQGKFYQAPTEIDTDTAFRACLTRLGMVDASLKPLEKGSTFQIIFNVHVKNSNPVKIEADKWIENSYRSPLLTLDNPKIKPIRTINIEKHVSSHKSTNSSPSVDETLRLQMFVEHH